MQMIFKGQAIYNFYFILIKSRKPVSAVKYIYEANI